MLHSGSRGIGNAIGTLLHRAGAAATRERNQLHLPDRDLAYFPEGAQHFDDYVEAVGWAQDYARANREEMMELVLDALRRHLPPFEVDRRGGELPPQLRRSASATSARTCGSRARARSARGAGELGIIPGQHGRAQLHRARQGQRRELRLAARTARAA